MKCLVEGCYNHNHQGVFVGSFCKPCYKIIQGIDEYLKENCKTEGSESIQEEILLL